MPLLDPLNDDDCLRKLHQHVLAFMQTERARALASQFSTVPELIDFIRHLDQRDDLGDPEDGPRIACDVTQRLRLPVLDPNCFERLALFLALALVIDPDLELTSATTMLDSGLHSFAVEIRDGRPHAVGLEPVVVVPLNVMNATAYELRNASPLSERHLGPWFHQLAWNACMEQGAGKCFASAMNAIRAALLTGEPVCHGAAIDCVFNLAHEDAQLFGARGRAGFDRVEKSLRNLSIKLDAGRVGKFLNKLINTVEPLAANAIKGALITEFGPIAAVALDGVDLGMAQVEHSKPTSNTLDTDNSDQEEDQEEDKDKGKHDDDQHQHRRERKRHLRRMSLAFRKPRNKER